MLIAWIWFGLVAASGNSVFAQPLDQNRSDLLIVDQIDLPRLVDLAAKKLAINVEYDPAVLKGSVMLRLEGSISDGELWDLTNRLLATRGFTTVRTPGSDVVSVISLSDTSKFAAVADVSPAGREGFASVVVRLKHKSVKDLLEPLRSLLSKPSGQALAISDSLLVVSDLTPRVKQVLSLVELMDTANEPIVTIEIPARHLTSSQLELAAGEFVRKINNLTTDKLLGELIATADGRSLLLACRQSDSDRWRGIVSSLDKRELLVTQSYSPRYFDLKAVEKLIAESVRGADTQERKDERFRVVVDDLTGTLLVTATVNQHEQVSTIIERLNAQPPDGRRPMRTFRVRNRSVGEVLAVLERLVSSEDFVEGVEGEGAQSQSGSDRVYARIAAPKPTSPSTLPVAPGISGEPQETRGSSGADSATRNNGVTQRGSRSKATGTSSNGVLLTADEGTSSIIAIGEPRALSQIEQLVKQLDVRQAQVMVQALVVSLSDSQSRQLGFELEGQINLSADSLLRLSSLFGLSAAGNQVGARTASGTGGTGLLLSPGEFAVVVRALETLNQGRSVSVPQVLVNNNQQATFNSTVEQPYASTLTTTNTLATTSFGGTASAGTVVTAKPQIAEGDHLILEYTVELSAFVGEAASANLPPPKQTNNVSSSVTLPDGFTVAVGGLDLTTQGESLDQVPLISQIPIVGEAFKNRSKSSSNSKFYVFLRAEVLRRTDFEDLKYLSGLKTQSAKVEDGFPVLEPRMIR